MKTKSQEQRILDLFARYKKVTLPMILDLRVASYRRRISDLREKGLNIVNYIEMKDGIRCSYYRLIK